MSSTGLFELHMKTKSYSLEWNQPTKNKFALAVIGDKGSVVGHLIKSKGGRFARTIFYFLRASEYHGGRVYVTG